MIYPDAPKRQILVVDDDTEIRELLGRYLSEQGFTVCLAGSNEELRLKLATHAIDLIVLDILLPDGSGLDTCRNLRAKDPNLSIILLTALKEDIDRIIGLEIGADDYLGKPFNPRELVARIRTVLRRADVRASMPESGFYFFSDFVVDRLTRTVSDAKGITIFLTAAEYDLLLAFLKKPGTILSRDQLLDATQGREGDPFDRSIDVLVSRLRRKLRSDGNTVLLRTMRNEGYLLATRVEERSRC